MPGDLLTSGSDVRCGHLAPAGPGATVDRVRMAGEPAVLATTPYTVRSCPNPAASGGPCATGSWTTGTLRVTSGGQPLALQDTPGLCLPTNVPLTAVRTQARVRAT
jgi:hypothetical protein